MKNKKAKERKKEKSRQAEQALQVTQEEEEEEEDTPRKRIIKSADNTNPNILSSTTKRKKNKQLYSE